ncbi:MAG: hypothetical protein IJB52_12765 [Clostridia bacterium]|nr:hypothetical protein [Clostridia bacterium]
MKKTIITLLLAAMMLSTLAACGDSGAADNTDAGNTAAETQTADPAKETTALEARLAVQDELPDKDFGGRNFTVIGLEANAEHILTEEQTGEGVNDAVFSRNLTVEERYNAKVAFVDGGAHRDCATLVANTITAGDSDAFDLVQFHVVSNSGNAMKGLYLNWYDVPYIDFEKPWWSDSNIEDLTINNHNFLAMGDFALTTISGTYCMFYDKDEAVNYQIEDLYEVVKDGRWTLDYLGELCETVYTDKNGDGEPNDGDYFGMASDQQSNFNTYLWAGDNKIFSRNSEGELEYTYYSEHLIDLYNKCYDLLNYNAGVFTKMDHNSGTIKFTEYGTLTCNALLGQAVTFLADFENEYGIIPYPKYDENQKDYMSMVDGSHEAMAVGKAAADLEFIGIMTEVLCAESYKQVVPAYYDVCLKQRYASSEKDAEMIDLCVDARVFDLGYVYDNWNGVAFFFQELLRDTNKQDISSYYAKKETAAVGYYDKVIALFEDAE